MQSRLLTNFRLFVCLVIYYNVLAWVYRSYLYPLFGYEGYELEPSSTRMFLVYPLLLVFGLFDSFAKTSLYHVVARIYIAFYAVPALVIFQYSSASHISVLLPVFVFSVVMASSALHFRIPRLIAVKRVSWLIAVLVASTVVVIVLLFLTRSFQGLTVSFANVYELRKEFLSGSGFAFGFAYLLSWVVKIALPALFLYFAIHKRFLSVFLTLLATVILFSYTGHKAYLLYPFLVLAIFFLLSRAGLENGHIYIGLTIVCLISTAWYLYDDNLWLLSLFVRRMLILPAFISAGYVELHGLKQHILTDQSVAYQLVVGERLLYDNVWANTGFVSSGYFLHGMAGVLLGTLLLVCSLWILDGLLRNRIESERHFWVSVAAVPFFIAFVSASMGTVLLTHGLLFLIFLIWIAPPWFGPLGRHTADWVTRRKR